MSLNKNIKNDNYNHKSKEKQHNLTITQKWVWGFAFATSGNRYFSRRAMTVKLHVLSCRGPIFWGCKFLTAPSHPSSKLFVYQVHQIFSVLGWRDMIPALKGFVTWSRTTTLRNISSCFPALSNGPAYRQFPGLSASMQAIALSLNTKQVILLWVGDSSVTE